MSQYHEKLAAALDLLADQMDQMQPVPSMQEERVTALRAKLGSGVSEETLRKVASDESLLGLFDSLPGANTSAPLRGLGEAEDVEAPRTPKQAAQSIDEATEETVRRMRQLLNQDID